MQTTAPRIVHFELLDNGGSGWIQEGTENTANPVELRNPSVRFVLNTGYRRKAVQINGRDTFMNERIRYIKNCPFISVEEQEKAGIVPHRDAREDQIPFVKGKLTVAEEGSTVALIEYLSQIYINADNPNRPAHVEEVFRMINFEAKAESTLDADEQLVKAQAYILALREKGPDGKYVYQTTKIQALCENFGIISSEPSVSLDALMGYAKEYPDDFIERAMKLDQTTMTDVIHGFKLSVIKREGNAVVFANKKKIVKNFGIGKFTDEKIKAMLADFFRTAEGSPAYFEFKAELEVAKEREIKNNENPK